MKLAGVILLTVVLAGSVPSPPDYSKSEHWAALPGKRDAADEVPANANLKDLQSSAAVDVFFIHPTTYYRSYGGNGSVDDKSLNDFTDEQSIRKQASVFNGSARVYAPRYRQAALHNFFKRDEKKSKKAFDIAYADVKAAFEYYLTHYNNGRPIIIAGHSQGSMHGMRLVDEFFDGTSRQKQLVAAYLIGYAIPKNTYSFIPVCNGASDKGCVVSYNTFGWEADPRFTEYEGAICVNPFSWRYDEVKETADRHQGAVPRTFDGIDANMLDCKCNNGVLWITKPRERGYVMMGGKNYHLMDYQLFYLDLRNNIADRVKAYLAGN